MSFISWFRRSNRKGRTGRGRQEPLTLERLEERLAPAKGSLSSTVLYGSAIVPLTYTAVAGTPTSYTLGLDATGTSLQLVAGGNKVLASESLADANGITITGQSHSTLTLDFTNGDPLFNGTSVIPLTFNGSPDNTGTLDVTGPIHAITYDASASHSGALLITDADSRTATVNFTGLAPINVNSSTTTVTITVTDTTAPHTLTFTAASAGMTTVTPNGGLESMTFTNPTQTLNVIGDDSSMPDTFTFTSLGSGFNASLDVTGESGNDTTNLNIPNLSVGAAGATDSVTVSTKTINLGGNIDVTGGGTTNNGTIQLNGNVVLNTSAALSYGSANGLQIMGAVNLNANTLTVQDSLTSDQGFIGGAITGSTGGLTKTGPGTLNVAGTGSNYTGATAIQNGTIKIGTMNALSTATTVTLGLGSTNGTLDLGGFSQQVAGLAVGTGASAAKQIIGSSSTSSNSTLVFSVSGGTSSFGGTIQNVVGSGTQTVGLTVAAGLLTLTGTNTYTGGTTLTGGTLSISADNQLGGTTGGIMLNGGTLQATSNFTSGRNIMLATNGNIDVTGTNTLILAGSVEGNSLTTTDTGTLKLSGTSNTLGTLNIQDGTVQLGSTGALSSSTALTFGSASGNGTLDLLNNNISIGSLSVASGATASGQTITNSGTTTATLTVSGGGSFGGAITGFGTALTVGGSGETLALSGDNTYSGNTTINSSDTLQVGAFDATSPNSTVVDDGTLDLAANSANVANLYGDSQGIVTSSAAGTAFLTLGFGGIFPGIIEDGGPGNFVALAIDGGTYTPSTGNTYSGGTTLSGATIIVSADNQLGGPNGSLTLDNGTLLAMNSFTMNATRTLFLGGNGNIDVTPNNTLIVAGTVNGGSLTTTDTGTLMLSGTNFFSGLNIQNGKVQVGSGGALSANNTVTLGAAASNGTLDLSGNNTTIGGLGVNSAVPANNLANQIVTNSANGLTTLTIQNGFTTFAGTITDDGMMSLTVNGGHMTLLGFNKYTGPTTIENGGILTINNVADGSLPSGLGSSSSSASNLILDDGTLQYVGDGMAGQGNSTDRLLTIGTGSASVGGTIDSSGTAALDFTNTGNIVFNTGGAATTLTLTGTSASNVLNTFSPLIGDVEPTVAITSFVMNGTDTWVLTNANTYAGTTTIQNGILSVSSLADGGDPSNIGQAASAAANLVIDGGTLQYTGATTSTNRLFTISANGGTLDASGAGTLTLSNPGSVAFENSEDPATLTLTGIGEGVLHPVVSDPTMDTDLGALVMEGTGTWVVSGADSYTGATTIDSGTLQVDGSLTSQVSVDGGTLTGDGTTGAVTVANGANLEPGDNPGILNTGALVLGATSTFTAEIAGTTAGTGYSQEDVTGTINLGGATLDPVLLDAFDPSLNESFTLISNEGVNAVEGMFNDQPEGSTVMLNGQPFAITYMGGTGHDSVVLNGTLPIVVTSVTVNGDTAPILMASESPSGPGTTVTITTDGPHGFLQGQRVSIAGVNVGGNTSSTNGYNGVWLITGVPSSTTFTYTATQTELAAANNGTGTATTDQIPSIAITTDIESPSGAGTTATATTASANGFVAGENVVIAGVTASATTSNAYNGNYSVGTVLSPTSFTYTASMSGLAAGSGGTASTTNANLGLLALGTTIPNAQRSMVDSIVYKFNEAVTLGNSALTLAVTSQTVTGTANAAHAPNVIYATPDGGYTWIATFVTGNGATVSANSIADGVYDITLNNAAVTAMAGGGTLASSRPDTFWRLFGDFTGAAAVNTVDRVRFNAAYASMAGAANFFAAFDDGVNGLPISGNITNIDRILFNAQSGKQFTGFAATI